jgi:hypothetical protein
MNNIEQKLKEFVEEQETFRKMVYDQKEIGLDDSNQTHVKTPFWRRVFYLK